MATAIKTALKNLFYPVSAEQQHAPDLGMLRLLGITRIIYAYWMLHTVTFGHVLFAPLYYPHSFWLPYSTSFLLGGAPDVAVVQWGNIIAIVSTVLLGLGLFTRWMGPLCFVACTIMLCVSFSYGRLNHNTNTVPLLLLIFSFTDWGHCYSLDALIRKWFKKPARLLKTVYSEWFIWLTLATFSLPYLTTGLFKLFRGHFMESGYISSLIRYKQIFWENHLNPHVPEIPPIIRAIQEFVIAHQWFSDMFIWGTLFIEVFFFIALLSKTSRIFMLTLALLFHSSIALTTKVYFFEHMMMVLLLLLLCLILRFREQGGIVASAFPKTPPDTSIDNNTLPVWQKTAWAYMASLALVFGILRLPLPEIALAQWNKLHILHAGYKFFPTDTYLFWYTNDQLISGLCLIFGAAILICLLWSYAQKLLGIVILEEPLKAHKKRVLIYDGDCGFCQNWVNWSTIQGANAHVEFTPFQRNPRLLEIANLSEEECTRYAIYVEFDASEDNVVITEKAAGSINAVLRHLPGNGNLLYRLFGTLYLLDGIKHLEELGYKIIAHNRHRLGSPACAVD